MIGKALLTLSAIASCLGPFIADFNETHVLNPRWPPHARFHNGQTMSMGLLLSLCTLYYTYRTKTKQQTREDMFAAAVFGSLYWISGMSAILYPGSAAIDPEFGDPKTFPQFWPFAGIGITNWVGWWLETRGYEDMVGAKSS